MSLCYNIGVGDGTCNRGKTTGPRGGIRKKPLHYPLRIHCVKGVFLLSEVNAIVDIISTVGFPIASSCVMLWLYYKQSQDRANDQKEWHEAILNNTKALELLREVISYDRRE